MKPLPIITCEIVDCLLSIGILAKSYLYYLYLNLHFVKKQLFGYILSYTCFSEETKFYVTRAVYKINSDMNISFILATLHYPGNRNILTITNTANIASQNKKTLNPLDIFGSFMINNFLYDEPHMYYIHTRLYNSYLCGFHSTFKINYMRMKLVQKYLRIF